MHINGCTGFKQTEPSLLADSSLCSFIQSEIVLLLQSTNDITVTVDVNSAPFYTAIEHYLC